MASAAVREALVKSGEIVEGRYRILKTLGEGGMGTVFLAEHALIKRRVAIKILHPELATDSDVIERFMNEARAAGTLGHPNIVESTDMGFTHGHVPYIVFEYLEGSLLTDEIYRVGGMPVARAARIAAQIASALHAAHNAGVVHRDLKSDNIFLTDRDDAFDHVKVLDFGISRFLEVEDRQRNLVMGTPEFMAPEQITSPAAVDRRADIYALGVILYEMLAARRPFPNQDDQEQLLHRIVHEEPAPLARPEVPAGLAALIAGKLMAKDPDQRLQSMGEVEAALDAFHTRDDGTPIPRRRTAPIAVASPEDEPPAASSGTLPRAARMIGTPWPGTLDKAVARNAAPVPPWRQPSALYGIAGAGLLVGAIGLFVGMRGGGGASAHAAPAPAAIAVRVEADAPGAHVVFRHTRHAVPAQLEVPPAGVVEMVEVSAPGHRTERYWITFDQPVRLRAHLVEGSGLAIASDAETRTALGAAAAP